MPIFAVQVNTSIHDVINRPETPNLPIPCRFICRNSANPNQIVYPTINGAWRRTGFGGNQNIYTYFDNTDANYANANDYNSPIRWQFIQEEMVRLNIEEITVEVHPL